MTPSAEYERTGHLPRTGSPGADGVMGAPPRPPRPRPLENFRLTRRLFADPASVLDHLRAGYGPVVELGPRSSPIVVIGGPGVAQEMFANPASKYRWAHKYNVVGLRFVIGRTSMIISDGADHDRRRAPVQPLFARRQLNAWVPLIVGRTDEALDELLAEVGAGSSIDIYPFGRRLIMGITLRALFGERLAGRIDEFSTMYAAPQAYIEAPALRQLPHPLPIGKRARVRSNVKSIDAMLTEEIRARRSEPRSGSADVLDALVDADALSDEEVLAQARSIIGAGYDTTAATLAWVLLRAAATSGVWAAVRAEADHVLGLVQPSGAPTTAADALVELAYTARVVRETLRLNPAGLVGVRVAADDMTLGGHGIRRGSLLVWSAYLAGRDPQMWEEPLRFDPDRFEDMTPGQQAASSAAWIPFGKGPHACLGFALAQMELTLILARFTQRFDPPVAGAPMPRAIGLIVNRPEGGARLTLTPRNASVSPGARPCPGSIARSAACP